VAGPARTGIAHYAWPGGLAVVFEGSGAEVAAVFGLGGWEHGPRRLIFPAEAPPEAAASFLALPAALVDQLAWQRFSGGALHTDFVFLDRLVRRLTPGTDDVVLLVLGRSPGALLCSRGRVTVIEPAAAADEPLTLLLPSLSGWIVVISGKVSLEVAAPPPEKPRPQQQAAAAPPVPPRAPVPPRVQPPAPEPAPAAPPVPLASPDGQKPVPATFGRFVPDARFVLASGAAGRLPPEVATRLAAIAGDAWVGLVGLLDGAHTLQDIASSTALTADRVAEALDVLVASKLAFRYVSRTRPQAGAPAGPR